MVFSANAYFDSLYEQEGREQTAFYSAQRAYMAALQGEGGLKTEARKAWATEHDKANHAELNAMRARPCNLECFDCTARKPGWAVLPHGVFVCIDCAQVHRNLGRHVSQTKAINTGTYLWFEPEMSLMRVAGNEVAARMFANGAPMKPSRDAPAATKAVYARAKYEEKRWGPAVNATKQSSSHATGPPRVPPSFGEVMQGEPASAKACRAARAFPIPPSGPVEPTGAGRSAAVSVPGLLNDLISLEEPVPQVATLATAPDDSWADFDAFPEAAPASPIVPPQPQPQTLGMYEHKKDIILSLFGTAGNGAPQPQTFRCGPISSLEPSNAGNFFANYGL